MAGEHWFGRSRYGPITTRYPLRLFPVRYVAHAYVGAPYPTCAFLPPYVELACPRRSYLCRGPHAYENTPPGLVTPPTPTFGCCCVVYSPHCLPVAVCVLAATPPRSSPADLGLRSGYARRRALPWLLLYRLAACPLILRYNPARYCSTHILPFAAILPILTSITLRYCVVRRRSRITYRFVADTFCCSLFNPDALVITGGSGFVNDGEDPSVRADRVRGALRVMAITRYSPAQPSHARAAY